MLEQWCIFGQVRQINCVPEGNKALNPAVNRVSSALRSKLYECHLSLTSGGNQAFSDESPTYHITGIFMAIAMKTDFMADIAHQCALFWKISSECPGINQDALMSYLSKSFSSRQVPIVPAQMPVLKARLSRPHVPRPLSNGVNVDAIAALQLDTATVHHTNLTSLSPLRHTKQELPFYPY